MDTSTPVYYTKQGQILQQLRVSGDLVGQRRPPVENKKPRCVFLLVLGPIMYCLRVLGGFPYSVKDDKLQVRLCSGWTVYSVIVISLQITLLAVSSHRIYFDETDYFDNQLSTTINIIVAVCQATGPLALWYEAPRVAKYFSKWYDYQEKLGVCGVELDIKLRRKTFMLLLTLIPFVLTTSYYQSVVHGGRIHIPAITVFHFISGLLMSMWTTKCLFIQSTSTRLIQHMKQLSVTKDTRGLADCRLLWLSLADLTADLGSVLGPTLLEILLLASAVVIINFYFLMFDLQAELAESGFTLGGLTAARCFFIIIPSMTVLFLCEFGHRSTTAVGFNFLHELLKLNSTPRAADFRHETKSFIQTVWHRYPNLELCGFVTLNRRLFVSLVSSGITYLIVLVQFRSQESSNNGH